MSTGGIHVLLWVLIGLGLVSFVGAFASFLRVWVAWNDLARRYPRIKVMAPIWIATFLLWNGMFSLGDHLSTRLREEVKSFVDQDESTITIGGLHPTEAEPLLRAIDEVTTIPAHHSHPESCVDVLVNNGSDSLALALGQDSQDPEEFWVFFPKYFFTSENNIGTVFLTTPPWEEEMSEGGTPRTYGC